MATVAWLWPVAMCAIVLIDYRLGATAEYLNAYEIVRRTFADGLPETSERFLMYQDRLGKCALAVAWLAWAVEAWLASALLVGAWRAVAAVLHAAGRA